MHSYSQIIHIPKGSVEVDFCVDNHICGKESPFVKIRIRFLFFL